MSAPRRLVVKGFASRPQVQRPNRNGIYIFVNRRLVRDRLLLHAIGEAYRNVVPPSTFPVLLLFLEVPYEEVDVNVHPAKIEVRFRHPQFVHDFTRDAIKQALSRARPIASFRRSHRRESFAATRGRRGGRRIRSAVARNGNLARKFINICAKRNSARRDSADGDSSRRCGGCGNFRWRVCAHGNSVAP